LGRIHVTFLAPGLVGPLVCARRRLGNALFLVRIVRLVAGALGNAFVFWGLAALFLCACGLLSARLGLVTRPLAGPCFFLRVTAVALLIAALLVVRLGLGLALFLVRLCLGVLLTVALVAPLGLLRIGRLGGTLAGFLLFALVDLLLKLVGLVLLLLEL